MYVFILSKKKGYCCSCSGGSARHIDCLLIGNMYKDFSFCLSMSNPYQYNGYTIQNAHATVNVSLGMQGIAQGGMLSFDFSSNENKEESDFVEVSLDVSDENLINLKAYDGYYVFVPLAPTSAQRVIDFAENTMLISSTC